MSEINYYNNGVKCHFLCSNRPIFHIMIYFHLPHWNFYSRYFMISFLLVCCSSVSNHIYSKPCNGLVHNTFVSVHATRHVSIETLKTTSHSIMMLAKYLVNRREFSTSSIVSKIGNNVFFEYQ